MRSTERSGGGGPGWAAPVEAASATTTASAAGTTAGDVPAAEREIAEWPWQWGRVFHEKAPETRPGRPHSGLAGRPYHLTDPLFLLAGAYTTALWSYAPAQK